MKKLKSILCMALMLVVGCVAFVGCGPKKEDNPPENQTTITLAEAKTTIVNALKIDEPQAQAMAMTYALANEQQGNRDIFIKFGKTQFVANKTVYFVGTELQQAVDETIIADKTGGSWNKYLMEVISTSNEPDNQEGMGTLNFYYDGINVYEDYSDYGGDVIVNNDNNNLSSQELGIVNYLFTDSAFNTLYINEVAKKITETGFTLTLTANMLEFYKYIWNYTGDDFEEDFNNMYTQEERDLMLSEPVIVTVNFDKNSNITKVNATTIMYSVSPSSQNPSVKKMIKQVLNVEITKYTGEIAEPQWVTDYIASQN